MYHRHSDPAAFPLPSIQHERLPSLSSRTHASLPSIVDILASHDSEYTLPDRPRSKTYPSLSYQRQILTPLQPAEDMSPWPSATQYHSILTQHQMRLVSTLLTLSPQPLHSHKTPFPPQIPIYDFGNDARGVSMHPSFIYTNPVSCMYFLPCTKLLGKGSFGFPRHYDENTHENGSKHFTSKKFEWRKMSFVTALAKQNALVRYITATCYVKTDSRQAGRTKKVFRMHAVMLANAQGTGEFGRHVLVHIRAGGSKRAGVRSLRANTAKAKISPGNEVKLLRDHRSDSNSSASTIVSEMDDDTMT
uniref:Uncharacterized protein AlNc14C137G7119 n=1 Tax=Albugo laibachii Nc14 TaxID=890382 RepID=F0WKS9_9STRA|nr:conserved hypothetical protein [Albugo laibachii Nc14]|eukprot:CCA21886.1 conserved hypothetical protein [Albugo laibachii Nc14]